MRSNLYLFIAALACIHLRPLTHTQDALSLPAARFGCEHKFQTKTFAITKLNRHELSSAWMHRYHHLLAHFSPRSLCSLPRPALFLHLRVGNHRAAATLAATERRILSTLHGGLVSWAEAGGEARIKGEKWKNPIQDPICVCEQTNE